MSADRRRRVLVVAASDPTGGAGVVADVATLGSMGVEVALAITAVTVQDSRGVHRVVPVEAEVIAEQIGAAFSSGPLDAAKVGVLPDVESVAAVARSLTGRGLPIVVDPVLHASAGGVLAGPGVDRALRDTLLCSATVVTPNLDEAAVLAGVERATLDHDGGAEQAAGLLGASGAAVLVTGGHRADDADDLLWIDGVPVWLRGPRRPGPDRRGTGCRLSSAVAAGLADGLTLEAACRQAKAVIFDGW